MLPEISVAVAEIQRQQDQGGAALLNILCDHAVSGIPVVESIFLRCRQPPVHPVVVSCTRPEAAPLARLPGPLYLCRHLGACRHQKRAKRAQQQT